MLCDCVNAAAGAATAATAVVALVPLTMCLWRRVDGGGGGAGGMSSSSSMGGGGISSASGIRFDGRGGDAERAPCDDIAATGGALRCPIGTVVATVTSAGSQIVRPVVVTVLTMGTPRGGPTSTPPLPPKLTKPATTAAALRGSSPSSHISLALSSAKRAPSTPAHTQENESVLQLPARRERSQWQGDRRHRRRSSSCRTVGAARGRDLGCDDL